MKPRTLLTTAALIAAALFILDVPAAMASANNFVGSGGGGDNTSWEDGKNWSDGVPDNAHNVSIGAKYTVELDQGDGVADSFDIDGTLNIAAGRMLTVDGSEDNSHALDGTINIYGNAQSNGGVLSFTATATQTITGSGTIDLQYYDSTTPANSASILIASGVTLGVYPTVCGCGIIRGDGSYTNNYLVHANRSGTLYLGVGGTLDDGAVEVGVDDDRWQASLSGARLWFHEDIDTLDTLDGDFLLSAGTIEIDVVLTTLGQLVISGGTLDADATTTMGQDYIEGVQIARNMSATGGKIEVLDGVTFTHE